MTNCSSDGTLWRSTAFGMFGWDIEDGRSDMELPGRARADIFALIMTFWTKDKARIRGFSIKVTQSRLFVY